MPTWAGPLVFWPPPSPWRGRTPWSRGSRCCRGRGSGTPGHRAAGTWARRTLCTHCYSRLDIMTFSSVDNLWVQCYVSSVLSVFFNVRNITVLKSSPLDNRWWMFWTSPGSASLCACSCSAARPPPRVCTWWPAGNMDFPWSRGHTSSTETVVQLFIQNNKFNIV